MRIWTDDIPRFCFLSGWRFWRFLTPRLSSSVAELPRFFKAVNTLCLHRTGIVKSSAFQPCRHVFHVNWPVPALMGVISIHPPVSGAVDPGLKLSLACRSFIPPKEAARAATRVTTWRLNPANDSYREQLFRKKIAGWFFTCSSLRRKNAA